MHSVSRPPSLARTLVISVGSSGFGIATSAAGVLVRTPLTVAALGLSGFGAVATVSSLYIWMQMASASARVSASALAGLLETRSDHAIDAVSMQVTRATARLYAPYFGAAVPVVVFAPIQRFIDPTAQMSRAGFVITLLVALVVALVTVYGSARIACLNTFGSYRAQNFSSVSSIATTTALTVVAYELGWSAAAFAVIWILSLATPGLGMAIHLARPRVWTNSRPTADARQLAGSGSWVVLGQQLASGFDLLIITNLLGSTAAGEYGLVWRVAQVVVAPVIGAGPLVVRAATLARTGEPEQLRDYRAIVRALLIMELLAVAVMLIASAPIFAVLGNGKADIPSALLVAGAVWCSAEVLRRVAIAASSTPADMKVWRSLSIATAVPNLVLSVVFTLWFGVSGPLVASVLMQVVLLAFGVRGVVNFSWRTVLP